MAMMGSEKFCTPCSIVTTQAKNRGKISPSNPLEPGHTVYMDLLPPANRTGLTPATTFSCGLWLVDRYSRYCALYGLPNYSAESVITAINKFMAPSNHPVIIEPIDINRIKADAGSQFTSEEFQQACADSRIAVNLAAPKHQEQNSFAESTWKTVQSLSDRIMVHSRLPPEFKFHADLYAVVIKNVIPTKDLINQEGNPATPFELFTTQKPRIAHLRVFGCPVVFRKWTITTNEGKVVENNTSQRGVRGIFIGLPMNQQGYLIFMPQSQRIAVSHDVTFDESFQTAVSTQWKPYQDALSLRPPTSTTHTDDDALYVTGSAEDFPQELERGNSQNEADDSQKEAEESNSQASEESTEN